MLNWPYYDRREVRLGYTTNAITFFAITPNGYNQFLHENLVLIIIQQKTVHKVSILLQLPRFHENTTLIKQNWQNVIFLAAMGSEITQIVEILFRGRRLT